MNRIELNRIAHRCGIEIEDVKVPKPFVVDIFYSTDCHAYADDFINMMTVHIPAASIYNLHRRKDGCIMTNKIFNGRTTEIEKQPTMKCMNPKCENTEEFQMASSRSLKDGGDVWCWVQCEECGMIGPKCDTAEDAKWFFEDREVLARPKSVNLNGDMGPGIFIRDEIGDVIPTGDEMKSLAAERFSTYSDRRKWSGKNGDEILADMEKLNDELKLKPKSRYDLEFDARGNPVLVLGPHPPRPPGLSPFDCWPRMLAKPFKKITDQDKEINELAEKCEASGLASKEETICAIKAMENKCVNAAEAGEKMREMCKVAMKNGTQLGHTESVLMNVEAAVGIPVDTEKYPHKCDCGSACYDNGFKIKCMNSECNWYNGGKS